MKLLRIALIAVAALVLVPILLFRMMWRVAEPNEALVISGLHERKPEGVGESLGFKIVTGKGTMVMPGVQMVRRLSLLDYLRRKDEQPYTDLIAKLGLRK